MHVILFKLFSAFPKELTYSICSCLSWRFLWIWFNKLANSTFIHLNTRSLNPSRRAVGIERLIKLCIGKLRHKIRIDLSSLSPSLRWCWRVITLILVYRRMVKRECSLSCSTRYMQICVFCETWSILHHWFGVALWIHLIRSLSGVISQRLTFGRK